MSATTDIEVAAAPTTTLFHGATPRDLIDAATDVATQFSEVVRAQRLYQNISGRQHVLIEGWQTVGTLVGVFAIKDDGVTQLPWPTLAPLGEQPQDPGREPPKAAPSWTEWDQARIALARWTHRRDLLAAQAEGLAFGFTASFQAVKDGSVIGWGEGRCDRGETHWTSRADFALQSMAQTRGQSRTLAAPLRFIVKLAGYETTPADELADRGETVDPDRVRDLEAQLAEAHAKLAAIPATVTDDPAGLDLAGQEQVVLALENAWPQYDALAFLHKLERRYHGSIPEAAGAALRAWAWFSTQPGTRRAEGRPEAAGSPTEASAPGAATAEPSSTDAGSRP